MVIASLAPLLSSPAHHVSRHSSSTQQPLDFCAVFQSKMASEEPGADAEIHPNEVDAAISPKLAEDEKTKPSSISKESLAQAYDVEASSTDDGNVVVSTAEEIVTKVIHVDDDPSLNPWTFRMFFLGTYRQVQHCARRK
jgi:hypothetical protein